MGLYISAFRKLVLAKYLEVDEDGYPVENKTEFKYFRPEPFALRDFQYCFYIFDDYFSFRVDDQFEWLIWLGRLAGYRGADLEHFNNIPDLLLGPEVKISGPFAELISYRGLALGSTRAKTLLRDFQQHLPKVSELERKKPLIAVVEYCETYRKVLHALELAADEGGLFFQ